MAKLSIVYFSGYGHTRRLAEAVASGAASVAGASVSTIAIDKEGNLPNMTWEALDSQDALIFGSPTYMGGPAWQFKKFADASSKSWLSERWKDKVAAGFTNSAAINGDKFNTITYMISLAMQHGMIWIGTGMLPASQKASARNEPNWMGGFSGVLAQSPADASPEEAPPPGDLETGRLFGVRVAGYAVHTRG